MGRVNIIKDTRVKLSNNIKLGEVVSDSGDGDVITSEIFQTAQTESLPIPGDVCILVEIPSKGRFVCVGVFDPNVVEKGELGDFRARGRDVSTGDQVCVLTVSNDGAISGSNAAGSFALESTGDFVVNGATITQDGDVVTSDGKSLRQHTHAQGPDSDGNTQVETDAPT